MSDFNPEGPIEINGSAIPSHIMSTLRQLIGYGVAWAVGKGYVDTFTGTQIGGAVLLGSVWLWREYITSRSHAKLVRVAEAAPNAIAVVK